MHSSRPGAEVTSVFYFSFTTLTTVGYGDITPVSDWAQALTVVEALTGQILLVAIVARFVGMQIRQSSRPASRPKEMGGP